MPEERKPREEKPEEKKPEQSKKKVNYVIHRGKKRKA